jgi:hypothetical protein
MRRGARRCCVRLLIFLANVAHGKTSSTLGVGCYTTAARGANASRAICIEAQLQFLTIFIEHPARIARCLQCVPQIGQPHQPHRMLDVSLPPKRCGLAETSGEDDTSGLIFSKYVTGKPHLASYPVELRVALKAGPVLRDRCVTLRWSARSRDTPRHRAGVETEFLGCLPRVRGVHVWATASERR